MWSKFEGLVVPIPILSELSIVIAVALDPSTIRECLRVLLVF
jgi:hypothetical protein